MTQGPDGWLLRRAARVVRAGGIVCHATEGAFGLAARAGDSSACLRLRQLKARPGDKNFIVVAADVEQIVALLRLEAIESQPVLDSWPGPETWILPASSHAPRWLAGRGATIAVRVTAHPQMARLTSRVNTTKVNLGFRFTRLSSLQAAPRR